MMKPEKTSKHMTNDSKQLEFFILFIIGFFIILVGVIVLIIAAALCGEGSMNFGAIIFIGPIPFIFGAGPEAAWMVLFAIILAVLSIIVLLMIRKETNKAKA